MSTYLQYSSIKNMIGNSHRPIIAGITIHTNNINSAHMVVIQGYTDGTLGQQISLMDPLFSTYQTSLYSTFTNGSMTTWVETINNIH